jgi:hypothetical protein
LISDICKNAEVGKQTMECLVKKSMSSLMKTGDITTEGFVKGLNFEKILAQTANNFSISNNGSHLGWDGHF